MPGTLYLLISRRTGCHKIGITRNVQQRYKALEVGVKADEVARWRVPNPEQLELFLHRRFKSEREPQTEWFHLSPEQVQWVVSAASKAADDLKQAAIRQPSQPVPATRPQPHTSQPDPTPAQPQAHQPSPAVIYRSADQARPDQVMADCLLNLAGMGAAGLALMCLAGLANPPAQRSYSQRSYSVSRPAAIPSPISSAPAPTAEQLEQQAQLKAEQKARELAEQLKQQQARDAQRQQREQADTERFELLLQVAEANRRAELASAAAEAQRRQSDRDFAIAACMKQPTISAVLTADEMRQLCSEHTP